ncbi:hypothetical protein [Thiosulfativibrio zosterae]|uniref:Uncharacterized protein n=1 Tax=Thiosulfativibrio zosterae TaxID=2675053 RepID=A0A6F8PRF6_9GAMM|nr:hypothetical protein [Thiosulfativibrio zosterae]BBP44570.1 hypothetical protein THMIRHAT_23160 [Thiosulfativibrio zosterae]
MFAPDPAGLLADLLAFLLTGWFDGLPLPFAGLGLPLLGIGLRPSSVILVKNFCVLCLRPVRAPSPHALPVPKGW